MTMAYATTSNLIVDVNSNQNQLHLLYRKAFTHLHSVALKKFLINPREALDKDPGIN